MAEERDALSKDALRCAGKTDKCKHGGKRCSVGCTKSAIGKTDTCAAHGGGKRCSVDGCTKSAIGKTNKCSSWWRQEMHSQRM